VHDALVVTGAAHHGMLLLTRDRLALDTYPRPEGSRSTGDDVAGLVGVAPLAA